MRAWVRDESALVRYLAVSRRWIWIRISIGLSGPGTAVINGDGGDELGGFWSNRAAGSSPLFSCTASIQNNKRDGNWPDVEMQTDREVGGNLTCLKCGMGPHLLRLVHDGGLRLRAFSGLNSAGKPPPTQAAVAWKR